MSTATPARATMTRPRGRPDTLVLSGGGVRGVATLGALERMRAAGLLAGVRTVVGTSAGALVGALVATRRDLSASLDAISAHGYRPDFDFERLSSEFGLDDGASIERLLRALLAEEDARITLGGVRDKYGVRLVVCVTNVSMRRAEYFGPETHADVPVALAVRMSCSVPLYFGAVRYAGHWYVDGSIVDNFPCDWARDHGAKWVLGVATRPAHGPIASLEAFVGAVAESAACNQACERADILSIEVPGVATLDLDAAPEVLARLYRVGYERADAFVKKHA